MSKHYFESYNSFITKRHRWIIAAWILAFLLAATFVPLFFSSVSYDIMNTGLNGGKNSESSIAQNIINMEFPSSNNEGMDSIVLVIQSHGGNVYSSQIKSDLLALNKSVGSDSGASNYTGMSSVYQTEYDFLTASVPAFMAGVTSLSSNVTTVNRDLYSLRGNLSALSSSIFELKQAINGTSQLVYGVPGMFVRSWEELVSNGSGPGQADSIANRSIYSELASEGPRGIESLPYYTSFYNIWNSSLGSQPGLTPLARETVSVNSAVTWFVSSQQVNSTTRALMLDVMMGLNATSWYQDNSISNLAIDAISAQIPDSLPSSLNVAPRYLVQTLYALGRNPSDSSLANLTIGLVTNSISASDASPGLSIPWLVKSAYALGPSPDSSAVWKLASDFFSNSAESSIQHSPLFTVNATSLSLFLDGFTNQTTGSQIQSATRSLVYDRSYASLPLPLSKSLTRDFVSSDNQTMLVSFNFSSEPGPQVASALRSDLNSSNIGSLAASYVTGHGVFMHDFEDEASSAFDMIAVVSAIVAAVIVGLFFLSPITAAVPLLVYGIAITISYASVYLGAVRVGGGQISFLTPGLASLLILGLAVDYSVLQLRRTREERSNGKTRDESVRISIRWAGEAVITAGITVIVAYTIMAVANVPVFSGVGAAIALGVSILLLASMTLLPSLELFLGDKLFWPGFRSKRSAGQGLLDKVTKRALKHKVLVASLITLIAVGATIVTTSTPTGEDFLRLVPNSQSNQGLTVVANDFGTGGAMPATILFVAPSPIVGPHNQFNQTLLRNVELISSTVVNSAGVVSVTSPTRPYGSPFNYASIQNMSQALYSQYLEGVTSQIGRDNRTALISVGLSSVWGSSRSVSQLKQVESEVNSLSLPPNSKVYFGGYTQGVIESQQFMSGVLPEILVLLAAAVYFILFLQLRSGFTPLRLVFTILSSVAVALAFLSATFYHFLNTPILNFAALFVVVTMMGVGIDYDIFYVTRIREEVLKGESDSDAIRNATTKVWKTVFGLGFVMAAVFASMLLTGIGILQEIGLALSTAVLFDVSVVILFFVPSLMAIAERFNWWPSKLRGKTAKSETLVDSGGRN